ncbi:MAG TPA: helicase-related protein [Candidatus Sulfotelmatobacter sp.]|nr:helicase-related protein [Candidatus Sulfotelmatobacter sp.]
MPELSTIYDYMRANANLLGTRILEQFSALHQVHDPLSPRIEALLRKPFPAQAVAIMGLAKRWQRARTGMVVAECGTGKTLISLGAIHVHSERSPFTALAMVPPHLVEKWAREAFLTLPGMRVFIIDDLRNGGDENKHHGVNEVRLRQGRILREGLRTSLSELRLRRDSLSSRKRWSSLCGKPSLFIVGRERAKLGYFWRHAFRIPQSGPYLGCVVNSDTGKPVIVDESRLTVAEFEKVRIVETVEARGDKSCRRFHSPLWQADRDKIRRMAPIEFIGRYMPGWFDYAVCDEIHQLAGDTAQGNALGTLASCTDRIVGLTGTLLGGYADDLFNTLFRLEAARMKEHGYEWSTTGRSSFTQDYGVLETITKVEPAENRCSKAKTTSMVRRKPGASPLLFGEFLMQLCAFVFLEDISGELPPYEEAYLNVSMDPRMMAAYRELEDLIRKALKEHRGNRSVMSTMLNTLLLYPDHPYGLGTLYGTEFDPELKRNVRFVIAETSDLPEEQLYSKERKLIEEIKRELAEGRRCQVFAVYTQKHDVTARLQRILTNEGIRTAVLRASVDTSKREAWYARQIKEGIHVVISHPKLVETGLDLLDFPTIIFYESGYSLHTLRQASRRSWRIGQRRPVRVKFLCYEGTMQTACLRLMGKKLLVALTMEGKFAGEGLQNLDEDDDVLSAMARELVERNGIGDTADAVWRALNAQHQKLFPSVPRLDKDHSGNDLLPEAQVVLTGAESEPGLLVEEALGTLPLLIFGQRPACSSNRRPRGKPAIPEQGSLFALNE